MDCKKEYYLQQITPMIHFQMNQTGAILRPSEVKPKLDRFIKERYSNQIKKAWYSDQEHDAFNYKMSIYAPENEEPKIAEPEKKLFFGNMGNKEGASKDYTVLYKQPIAMTIICFVPELRRAIDDCIATFFVLHNFGKRSSKGFGGFIIKGTNPLQILKNEKNHNMNSFLYMAKQEQMENLMITAGVLYSVMKTGINFGDSYQKGYVMTMDFFKDVSPSKKIGNDKAFMKADMFKPDHNDKGDKVPRADEYLFVRSMLGLADHYEFRKGKIEGTPQREGMIKIESVGDDIQRFQSPVQIKIFDKMICFLPQMNEIPKEMCDKEFSFSINKPNNSVKCTTVRIKTPKEFELSKFLVRYAKWFNGIEQFKGNALKPIKDKKFQIWERGKNNG